MRRLVLLLVLLVCGVVAAWLALRAPRAESVSAVTTSRAAEDQPASDEESFETSDAFAAEGADERELVDVEEAAGESVLDGPRVRTLRGDERWARIRVLDGATGGPVELFGARASPRASKKRSVEGTLISRMLLERHPDGLADVPASPRAGVLQIEAHGYAQFEGELLADAFSDGAQSVELARGGAVIGRVMTDKHPAKSVRVRLRRAPIVEHDAARGDDEPYDLTRFQGRSRSLSTGRDGAFAFQDLAFGTYELDLRRGDGARARVEALQVLAAKRIDLGDIALTAGATLRGRALLPLGARAEGVRLSVQATDRSSQTMIGADASFEFDGLPAGPCSLTVAAQPGSLIGGPPFEFELVANERREVVLDLRDRAGMWVEARVRSRGQPIVGSRVEVLEPSATERYVMQDDGSQRWWQAPAPRVGLRITSSIGMPLGRYERDVVVLANGEGRVELDLELAELRVDWRQITASDELAELELHLESLNDPTLAGGVSLNGHDREDEMLNAFARRELALGPVAPDKYAVTLAFYPREESFAEAAAFTRTLELRPGESFECVLTDADRAQIPARARGLGY